MFTFQLLQTIHYAYKSKHEISCQTILQLCNLTKIYYILNLDYLGAKQLQQVSYTIDAYCFLLHTPVHEAVQVIKWAFRAEYQSHRTCA